MLLREPVACEVVVHEGLLTNSTGRYERRLSDLRGLYADEGAFEQAVRLDGDKIIYDVSEFRPSSDGGDMIFGVTRISPGKVGREYNMTRGHIHRNAKRPEIYYGEAGEGVLLLESPLGEVRTMTVRPRVICYVPPYWIHRSINTGSTELVMTFAYPADAGQDYQIIAHAGGMRKRIVDEGGGGWVVIDNQAYQPRSLAQVDAIFETVAAPQ